jgi:hypothetical protein
VQVASLRRSSIAVALAVLGAIASRADAAESPRGVPAGRAEIQVGLCAPFAEIERALHLRADGGPVETWLFDDAALSLIGRGLRLRLRIAGGGAELTLKVANQDCAHLDPKIVPRGAGKCEYDLHGTTMAGAVSLSRRLSGKEKDDLVAGRTPPAALLSPVQIGYLREAVGVWPLPPQIRALGPIEARSYRTQGEPYDVDVSRLPAGDTHIEISRKVPVAEALRAKSALDAALLRAGVPACADQSAQAVNKLRALLPR